MPGTKHHILRLNDETWARLAEQFRDVIDADQRPPGVRADSNWQITEGLRRIAAGTIKLEDVSK